MATPNSETPEHRPRIVVLGCGFAGLWAAQGLRRAPVEVTVVDRTNHHLFTPLLYQVATAGLSAPAIASPIRHILAKQRNTTVLLGEVTSIDVRNRKIPLEEKSELAYDRLIVATGATHSYFGNDAWAPFAPGLKTLDDAFEIRSRILLAFERAERETDTARSEEHTSELQSPDHLVCRLLLEKKKKHQRNTSKTRMCRVRYETTTDLSQHTMLLHVTDI